MSCQCQVSDAESYIRCNGGYLFNGYIYTYTENIYIYIYIYMYIYIRRVRKSAQHFHQFSCSLWFLSCWKLGICHIFISWWCLLALHFHWDLWKFLAFIAVGAQKCMLNTLKKRYVFWMVLRFATAPAILFPSLQLADRLCSDITHISISMYVSPLPSLDICHDHWTLASYLAASFYRPSSNHLLYQYGQAPLGCLAGHGAQSL